MSTLLKSILRKTEFSPGPLLSYGLAPHPPGMKSASWSAGKNEWNIGYTLAGDVREILPQGKTWEHPHAVSYTHLTLPTIYSV